MSVTQPLRISYIELQSAKNIECIELIFPDSRRSIRQQGKNHFREEFPQSLAIQGEAFSFLVHWKKWYSWLKPAVENVRIDVRDILSNSQAQKFQTMRVKLDITIGLSPSSTSVDVVRAQDNPAPPNTDGLRSTTGELLGQCPRFRILVMGQSGIGKSTLINRAFGIEQASAEHFVPGEADVEKELISPQNNRFVLHDSKGFEPGDDVNYDNVRRFIENRKNREHVKDQLHAVWLCFRIPAPDHGERLLEQGMETFLKGGTDIFRNIPAIVVFTKYDELLGGMKMQKKADPDTAAKEYLQEHCFDPIAEFTGSTDLSFVAVSSKPGLEQGHKQLINLTHQKVTERFRLQTDTPSPVSVVTLMAQRTLPNLKIEGSIDVGRQRYWRTLTSSANFKDHTIIECLAVIHTDIVCVWNFNDPFQYLYSDEFRRLMVGTTDAATPASRNLSRVDSTNAICEAGSPLMLLVPLILPLEAGLGFVQWAHKIYQRLPKVHHKFMAYIVDLVHVLEILFALTANNNEKKLTRGAITLAFNAYYYSEMRLSAHQRIKRFDFKVPGRDTVLEKIISLVRMSPVADSDISRVLASVRPADLERDEEWRTNASD